MSAESGIGDAVSVVVTCEHAGNEVPEEYRELFTHAHGELESHRGFDPGALRVALRLSALLGAPLFHTPITRLLIEANRSMDHADLFSRFTRLLPDDEKQRIIEAYYLPHRCAIERTISALIAAGRRVVHVGVHSFTDHWAGQDRDFEIGLLFDPGRTWEHHLCKRWGERMQEMEPDARVRMNEPYLGTDDGLTTALRTRLGELVYAGVEVELRQGLLATTPVEGWADLLAAGLRESVNGL